MRRITSSLSSQDPHRKHFRYRKVTPDLLEFMKQLKAYQLNYRQIAKICELNPTSVQYHLDPQTRKLTVIRARRYNQKLDAQECTSESQSNLRRRRWMREYLRERYHGDPEFRTKVLRANMGGRFAD